MAVLYAVDLRINLRWRTSSDGTLEPVDVALRQAVIAPIAVSRGVRCGIVHEPESGRSRYRVEAPIDGCLLT